MSLPSSTMQHFVRHLIEQNMYQKKRYLLSIVSISARNPCASLLAVLFHAQFYKKAFLHHLFHLLLISVSKVTLRRQVCQALLHWSKLPSLFSARMTGTYILGEIAR
jgi:hypothetical protein